MVQDKPKPFNWASTITANIFVLKCTGLWPQETYKCNFYTCYAIINAVVIIAGHNFSQIINIFFVYSDLEVLAATVFVLITNVLGTVKMFFYVRNMKVLKQLFQILDTDQFQPKSIEQVKLVNVSLRIWKVMYFSLSSFVAVNLLMWIVSPVMNKGQKLPFVAWYPFEIDCWPNYQLVYVYQVVGILYITFATVNLDTMTFALMVYIWAQCDLLCDDLKHLEGCPLCFNKALVNCIQRHKNIVRFAEDSNGIFNTIILGQFFTSTVVLALTMFQLSVTDPLSEEAINHLIYITGMITQIFLYCWFGNEVEIKSSQILYAIYSCDWFRQPKSVKKNLIFLGLRCQKPIRITAIKLFAVSLNTFIKILRSAWSYFALLYQVNNQK